MLLLCYYYLTFAFSLFKYVFLFSKSLIFTLSDFFCLRMILFLLCSISINFYFFFLIETCIIQFFLVLTFTALCIWLSIFINACISLPIGTNGKPLTATGKFLNAIGKLMIGKILAINKEEITKVMIGNDVSAIFC